MIVCNDNSKKIKNKTKFKLLILLFFNFLKFLINKIIKKIKIKDVRKLLLERKIKHSVRK